MNLKETVEHFMEVKGMTLVEVQEGARPRMDDNKIAKVLKEGNAASEKTLRALAFSFKIPIEEFVAQISPQYLTHFHFPLTTPQRINYTLEEKKSLERMMRDLDRW